MAEMFEWLKLAALINERNLKRNARPTVPIDPAEYGKRLEFKIPCRALIERPAFALDVPRGELGLRGSRRGSSGVQVDLVADCFRFERQDGAPRAEAPFREPGNPSAFDPNDCTS